MIASDPLSDPSDGDALPLVLLRFAKSVGYAGFETTFPGAISALASRTETLRRGRPLVEQNGGT